jgi:hypothetical protein
MGVRNFGQYIYDQKSLTIYDKYRWKVSMTNNLNEMAKIPKSDQVQNTGRKYKSEK